MKKDKLNFFQPEEEKNLGQCRLGIKTKSGVQWRNLFEANCVLLNDFKMEKEFTL